MLSHLSPPALERQTGGMVGMLPHVCMCNQSCMQGGRGVDAPASARQGVALACMPPRVVMQKAEHAPTGHAPGRDGCRGPHEATQVGAGSRSHCPPHRSAWLPLI